MAHGYCTVAIAKTVLTYTSLVPQAMAHSLCTASCRAVLICTCTLRTEQISIAQQIAITKWKQKTGGKRKQNRAAVRGGAWI